MNCQTLRNYSVFRTQHPGIYNSSNSNYCLRSVYGLDEIVFEHGTRPRAGTQLTLSSGSWLLQRTAHLLLCLHSFLHEDSILQSPTPRKGAVGFTLASPSGGLGPWSGMSNNWSRQNWVSCPWSSVQLPSKISCFPHWVKLKMIVLPYVLEVVMHMCFAQILLR